MIGTPTNRMVSGSTSVRPKAAAPDAGEDAEPEARRLAPPGGTRRQTLYSRWATSAPAHTASASRPFREKELFSAV